MNDKQISKAFGYYLDYTDWVVKEQVKAICARQPKQVDEPKDWNGEHWKWFFDVLMDGKIM